nr:UL95 [Eptesicus fuscus gammaherpesvirus]
MFNCVNLATGGNPELARRYARSVELAVDLCETVPGQFKLVETPLNSFLLVTNIMPDDERPLGDNSGDAEGGGSSGESDGSLEPEGRGDPGSRELASATLSPSPLLDFSNLRLPRLEALDRICAAADATRNSKFGGGCSPDHSQPSSTHSDDGTSDSPPQPRDTGMHKIAWPPHYVVYDAEAWGWALRFDRRELVERAVELLAHPTNWRGTLVDDPLPIIWLLFYGARSSCAAEDCLYLARFPRPGPVLLPPHMYKPHEDLGAFMRHAALLCRFLYRDLAHEGRPLAEVPPPFHPTRLTRAVLALDALDSGADAAGCAAEDGFCAASGLLAGTGGGAGAASGATPGPVYLSRTCLLCVLYRQNLLSGQGVGGCLILGGAAGVRYITPDVTVTRCARLGDAILYPCYNVARLLADLSEGEARHAPSVSL